MFFYQYAKKIALSVFLLFIGALLYDALIAPKKQIKEMERANNKLSINLTHCQQELKNSGFENKWAVIAKKERGRKNDKNITFESNGSIYF